MTRATLALAIGVTGLLTVTSIARFDLSAVASASAKATADKLAEADDTPSWNRVAAGAYLDQRQGWWMTWPTAARDHETSCVS